MASIRGFHTLTDGLGKLEGDKRFLVWWIPEKACYRAEKRLTPLDFHQHIDKME